MKKFLVNVSKLTCILVMICGCNKAEEKPNDKGSEKPAATGTIIKVMSYNIHIGNPPSKSSDFRDLQAIANVINREKPDLVALNEVDVNTRRSGTTVDQAKELAALTGMYYFYTKAIDYQGGQFGDAVLSRFPIIEKIRYELPVTEQLGGETRSVAMITVEKDGKRLRFASTHLDHLGQEDNRILQAQRLKEIIATISDPLILCGDLNAKPDSRTITIMKEYMSFGCTQGCPLTFPSVSPHSTIDYISYKPLNKFVIKNYRTVNETYASDHLPLTAEIELK